MSPGAELVVNIHGDDHEHANNLLRIVSDTIRGIGLTMRTDTMRANGQWFGGGSTYWMDVWGEHMRAVTTWNTDEQAKHVGELLVEWLEANLWSHHRTLGTVYVRTLDGNQSAIHLRRKASAA